MGPWGPVGRGIVCVCVCVQIVNDVFRPSLDSGKLPVIAYVEKEILTAANVDLSATVDGGFDDRRT